MSKTFLIHKGFPIETGGFAFTLDLTLSYIAEIDRFFPTFYFYLGETRILGLIR